MQRITPRPGTGSAGAMCSISHPNSRVNAEQMGKPAVACSILRIGSPCDGFFGQTHRSAGPAGPGVFGLAFRMSGFDPGDTIQDPEWWRPAQTYVLADPAPECHGYERWDVRLALGYLSEMKCQ